MLKTGEMLKMLKLENPNLSHFPGNVKDAKDVNVFLGNLNFLGGHQGDPPGKLSSLTFPLF